MQSKTNKPTDIIMKSIKFKQSWCEAIAQFEAYVRIEIYGATVAYYVEGVVPEGMSDLARGAFAFIKADIDASRRRAERARAARLARAKTEGIGIDVCQSVAQPASVEAGPAAAQSGMEAGLAEENATDIVAAEATVPPVHCAAAAVPRRRSRKSSARSGTDRHNVKKSRRVAFVRRVERRIRALNRA